MSKRKPADNFLWSWCSWPRSTVLYFTPANASKNAFISKGGESSISYVLTIFFSFTLVYEMSFFFNKYFLKFWPWWWENRVGGVMVNKHVLCFIPAQPIFDHCLISTTKDLPHKSLNKLIFAVVTAVQVRTYNSCNRKMKINIYSSSSRTRSKFIRRSKYVHRST